MASFEHSVIASDEAEAVESAGRELNCSYFAICIFSHILLFYDDSTMSHLFTAIPHRCLFKYCGDKFFLPIPLYISIIMLPHSRYTYNSFPSSSSLSLSVSPQLDNIIFYFYLSLLQVNIIKVADRKPQSALKQHKSASDSDMHRQTPTTTKTKLIYTINGI